MTDEPKFPARRGPACDGYRMLFLALRLEPDKAATSRRRGTAAPAKDPAPRHPTPPRKLFRRAAH
jgi:hypothetical protein